MSGELKGIAELLAALRFAAEQHSEQRRKGKSGKTPYVNHPIQVAEVLVRIGGIHDPVTLCAALLHDVVEDTSVTIEQIDAEFGVEVSGVVAEVTDDKTLEKQERKRRQEEHAPHLSDPAKHVKLGDKICNVVDLTNDPPAGWDRERLIEYLDWTERVIAGCRDANAALAGHYDEVLAEARRRI